MKTGENPELKIGKSVSIMNDCQISCISKIEIGDRVIIGANAVVTKNISAGESNWSTCYSD